MKPILFALLLMSFTVGAMTLEEQTKAAEDKIKSIDYFKFKVKNYSAIAKSCNTDRLIHKKSLESCQPMWDRVHEWELILQEVVNKPLEGFIEYKKVERK